MKWKARLIRDLYSGLVFRYKVQNELALDPGIDIINTGGEITMSKKNIKIRLIAIGLLIVFSAILISSCQSKEEKLRIGILCGLSFFRDTADGFKDKLTELGYIEGKNVDYDFRNINSDIEAYRGALKEFAGNKYNLVFVFPTDAAVIAKNIISEYNIPILFANANIEGLDLVESLREPGSNITGVRYPGPDLTLKRYELMRKIIPEAKRFWVPYWKESPIVPAQLDLLRPAAAADGIIIYEAPAEGAEDLAADLKDRSYEKGNMPDAVLLIAEALGVSPASFAVFGKFASEHNIPIGGAMTSFGEYTSIFGVSTDNIAVGRQAAEMANKIFKGSPAGSIPVISAENFLTINYKEIQRLGLNISESLLSQANKIIR